jgi:FkbM family methyltransferase
MRAQAMRVIQRLGLEPQARSLQRALVSKGKRRDLRDQESLRLLLAFTLSADSNCIDVGAHSGGVLDDIVRLAPRGRHIAYEPIPHLSADLERRYPQVDVRRAALSNERTERRFRYVRTRPAMSGLRERDYGGPEEIETITVRTEDLDSALPVDYVPTLVKIDVEGGEREVLQGAIETISTYQPIVVFEHGKGAAPHYGTHPFHVFDLLSERAGLRIFDLDGNGPFGRDEFATVFEIGDYWNFVARR